MLLTYLCIKEDKYITYIILGLVKILDNIIQQIKDGSLVPDDKDDKVYQTILDFY